MASTKKPADAKPPRRPSSKAKAPTQPKPGKEARAKTTSRSRTLRSAAAFAAQAKAEERGGVGERAFQELERIRAGVELLVNKQFSIRLIHKWVKQELGPGVVNLTSLQRYLKAHLNYSPEPMGK